MSGMMDDYNRLYRERRDNPFKPDNDNDKAPDHLKELFGKKVQVSCPNDSSRWRGTLAGYFERPVIVLTGSGLNGGIHGSGTLLPATYPVAELTPPPKIEPCPTCGHVNMPAYGTDPIIWWEERPG